MRIYLADLGHNLLTYSSDVYPLGVANLATWTMSHVKSDQPLEISIFKEPQDLKKALDEAPPALLGLSNYAWNQRLTRQFACYAKAKNSSTMTVLGGPNWPLTLGEQEEFARDVAEIDVFVEGTTYEGEVAFGELMQRFVDVGGRIDGVLEQPPAGCVVINGKGEFEKGIPVKRIKDLDEIPSPYLAGYLDPFFETGYFPLIQIARGCPFTCQFCNSSVIENNRVYAHSVDNVKADLLYIAERVKPELTLCTADDNFGMYKRDEEIADYIRHLQDTFEWPKYIRTTTGKNSAERIIRVMRKVRGALPMTAAVQSMNPEVLANIQRDNIKISDYEVIQQELLDQGMQSYGELILCLPGETKVSFMGAVKSFLDAGSQRVSAHQLMLLHGAPLANPETREKYGFETRFRVVARNIGNYTGEPVVEIEEMVVATPTLDYEDYIQCRIFHLLLTIFHYEGNYEEVFEYAKSQGLSVFDFVTALHENLDSAPAAFRKVIADFVKESEEELFLTADDCLTWSNKNYDSLVDGTLGGNLLSKYSMFGRFYATTESLDYLAATMEGVAKVRGWRNDPEELQSVISYLHVVLLKVPFVPSMGESPTWATKFDVETWRNESYVNPLSDHTLSAETTYQTMVEDNRRQELETKIGTFGEHPAGLGKITRTMFARDLRRTIHKS
ncbi:MAG: radical SAM superfamily enzyme YgiQ (UPF0313 family) [Planctomycetota bacterium]|jgi:radical SAM superfamily enzyme YgiQ (UPF0313 family)